MLLRRPVAKNPVLPHRALRTKANFKKRRGLDLEKLAGKVAEIYRIEAGQLLSRGRQQQRVQARDLFFFWAAREIELSLAGLARHLEMSPPAVGYAMQRG
jgi:chromosomal replication initiation ATPase DnaA